MSMKAQLELVRECYDKVASAQSCYNAYRLSAGESGETTSERPEFVALLTALTRTAEDIDRRDRERRMRFNAVPVLQAALRFKDGSVRRVAVSKPTGEIDEPHIGEMFHAALVSQGLVASLESYPVLVVDKRRRVVAKIPAATADIML